MRRLFAGVVCAFAAGCGAKTGLRIPHYDAASAMDAGTDAPDAFAWDAGPLECVAGRFPLIRGTSEVMFVLDRSGSMAFSLDGSMGPPRRWDVLHDALATTLPAYQDTLAMGAYVFPRRFDGGLARSCDVTRAIDLEPTLFGAAAVLQILEGTDPWGATPTASALTFVSDTVVARVTPDHSATVILATDGGPNCNPALDVATCVCTAADPMGSPTCFGMPTNCLDDARAVDAVAALASRGVATFVIGLDADTEPSERMALEEMARAGGRPNPHPGEPAYYTARRPDQITTALDEIERSITRCTLRSPSQPDDPDALSVLLDGTPIPRDRSHMDGWDWTDTTFAQVTFFGAACERVAGSTSDPEVVVACTDR